MVTLLVLIYFALLALVVSPSALFPLSQEPVCLQGLGCVGPPEAEAGVRSMFWEPCLPANPPQSSQTPDHSLFSLAEDPELFSVKRKRKGAHCAAEGREALALQSGLAPHAPPGSVLVPLCHMRKGNGSFRFRAHAEELSRVFVTKTIPIVRHLTFRFTGTLTL